MKQAMNPLNQIFYKTERSCLRPIPKNSQVFSSQSLTNKSWKYTAIIESHSWTIRIKYASYSGFNTMEGMVCHSHGFLKSLCFIINSTRAYWVYISKVSFRLGMFDRISVHLRGRCDKNSGFFNTSKTKTIVNPQGTYFQGLNRDF